jgi:60 kDa SS-A/Ro ribonucleoprotein
MANKKIFASAAPTIAAADTTNHAGGVAYALAPKAALAQMVVTGVFNDTFYTDASSQLAEARSLVGQVEPEFLAKLAVYAREKAFMKDMPAYLAATLASRDVGLLTKVFGRVVDNGKMLRNFVQMVRSGQVGRKSLGSRPKKLVAGWLTAANDAQLLSASVGNAPSLADVVRLSHPKAGEASRDAFFGYVLGRKVEPAALPMAVRQLEAFRKGESTEVPKVPFELLTSLPLSAADWKTIARNASWTQTRMNLNTFLRHGVFDDRAMVTLIAERLRSPEQVARAKVFPYQLLAAYKNVNDAMPSAIVNALQDAMELAVENVPAFDREVAMLVDTSGSMKDPVTGNRGTATTKVRCVDVAGLFASAVLRKNPDATVVPFDTRVHEAKLNSRDAIVTNASKLAQFGGGGTDCGCALAELNRRGSRAELVVYVSDNESWVNSNRSTYWGRSRGTAVMEQWAQYKRRVPKAKLVCIDITPNTTSQAKESHDILNVGGFSDEVFNVVARFARGELTAAHWVGEIEKVQL